MWQVKCHFLIDNFTPSMKATFARMLYDAQKCISTVIRTRLLCSTCSSNSRTMRGSLRRNCTVVMLLLSVPCMGGDRTTSANNVYTVSTSAPFPANQSASIFNVLEPSRHPSPSNQTVSTQVTIPPVRNTTKHVDNQAPSVYMGAKLTKNYEPIHSQPSSSASSSIASTITEHDSLESKNHNGSFFRPDCSSYCMTQTETADNPCHQ
jgi:hypothetical protein